MVRHASTRFSHSGLSPVYVLEVRKYGASPSQNEWYAHSKLSGQFIRPTLTGFHVFTD